MLLFITLLIAILLTYVVVCSVIFIYRRPRCISLFHRIIIIIFFLLTGCFFGFKAIAITILAYYVLLCVLTFILRKLSKSIIDYSLLDKDNFSCNSGGYSAISRNLFLLNMQSEKQNNHIKLSRLFLCAFVPLWLIGFLAFKTFTNSLSCASFLPSITQKMKNKIVEILKSI